MPRDLGVMLFDSVSVASVQMEAAAGLSERLKRRRDSVDSEDSERDEKRVEADIGQIHGFSSTDSNPSQSMKQVLADNDFFSKLKTEYRIGSTTVGSSGSSSGSAGGSSAPSASDAAASSCSLPYSTVTSHPTDSTGYPVGQGISAMSPLECGLEDLVRQLIV